MVVMDTFTDDTETWIDDSGRDLSQRIWGNRAGLRAQIDRMIADAMVQGLSVDEVTAQLIRFVSPDYARSGEGKARYAANRLANHEMRRAQSQATQHVSIVNPAGGYLRFVLNPAHTTADVCDTYANHDEGLGRGVWPAGECPIPPVHIGDLCRVEEVKWEETGGSAAIGMSEFVERLRIDYGLADPPDMSPEELTVFRQETAAIRQGVVFMMRAWLEQTGLVTTAQLLESSESVSGWVSRVREEKRRRGEHP